MPLRGSSRMRGPHGGSGSVYGEYRLQRVGLDAMEGHEGYGRRVTNGTATAAKRVDKRSRLWEITIAPSGSDAVDSGAERCTDLQRRASPARRRRAWTTQRRAAR